MHREQSFANARFQHTAARRRLLESCRCLSPLNRFQHTAARRRLRPGPGHAGICQDVSTHSRPKAAAEYALVILCDDAVSTHSRPKAAAASPCSRSSMMGFQHTAARRRLRGSGDGGGSGNGFNTQPPEGGCIRADKIRIPIVGFNTQPPEGGCGSRWSAWRAA